MIDRESRTPEAGVCFDFGGSSRKVYILDEAERASKALLRAYFDLVRAVEYFTERQD